MTSVCIEKLYQRRLLIRLVGVKYGGLTSGTYQINLFDDEKRTVNLYNAMDNIRIRFGDRSIMRASTLGDGARTIGNFTNPFNGEPPIVLAHRHQ